MTITFSTIFTAREAQINFITLTIAKLILEELVPKLPISVSMLESLLIPIANQNILEEIEA